jgi:hypothetical protein
MNSLVNKMDLNTKFMTNPNMVLRVEGDDCAILFDPDAGSVRILNVTAAAVWQLLNGERSVTQLFAHLRETYTGFNAQSETQVLKLLTELQGYGALTPTEELVS